MNTPLKSFSKLLRNLKHAFSRRKQALLGYPREKEKFLARHGYPLNLRNPSTFSEKIVWKKIHDRSPLLPLTADKYRVREYVKRKLGSGEADGLLIPLLHVSENAADIPFNRLPDRYVAKANHGSGWNAFVRDNSNPPEEIRRLASLWLSESYGASKLEWAYQNIPRRVVFEPLLQDDQGKVPKDYKFFMIHGTCRMVQVDSDRFEVHTRTLYTPEWNRLDVTLKFPAGPNIPPPENLERMLKIAGVLADDFDFVRVDLYSLGDKVYFGELTHYPESGMGPIHPRAYDIELGSYWTISRKTTS